MPFDWLRNPSREILLVPVERIIAIPLHSRCAGITIWYDIFIHWNRVSTQSVTTVHDYTQTIHRMIQNKKMHITTKIFWKSECHVTSFWVLTWHFITTEEKARKKFSQGRRRVQTGTKMLYKHTIRIHRHKNKNTYLILLNRTTTIHTVIKVTT